jgi:hypothetical protein
VFRRRYPEGLTRWGQWYAFGAGVEELVLTERKARALGIADEEVENALNRSTNRLVELIWELARAAWFPERPSRLRSIFGYRDLHCAGDLRTENFGDDTLPIWRVAADQAFHCDSAWLDLGSRSKTHGTSLGEGSKRGGPTLK